MLNLIQHLLWKVEIAGQARNDAALNKKKLLRHNIINLTLPRFLYLRNCFLRSFVHSH